LLALSQELERDVDAFSNSIDFSPEELAQIEERLDVIGRLMKKYMRDEEGLLALERETAGQLAAIEAMDE
ncbi:DNA repair protein RecN, partial [Klebsiella oxytoca]